MVEIFKTYITPQLKEIYHPEILQEWKLNIDAKEYEKNMLIMLKQSSKKKINRIDNFDHWPKSIKELLNGFHFLILWNILEKT